jgi:hypothetical protein
LAEAGVTPRPGDTLGKILIGFLLAVVGLPFLAASVVALLLLENLGRGLAVCVVAVASLLLLAGPQAAAMAALGSCSLYLALSRGRSLVEAASICTAAMMGGALLFFASQGSVFMFPYGEQGQVWRDMLTTMGFTASEAAEVIETTFRVLPGVSAVWISTGGILSTVFLSRLADSRALELPPRGELRLGLLPAWAVIVALAARLLPGAPDALAVWADNVLIFMALPYLVVGLAVAGVAVRGLRVSPLPLVLVLVLLPHVAVGLLAVGGLLDTWFDFRAMITARIARKRDEGSSD